MRTLSCTRSSHLLADYNENVNLQGPLQAGDQVSVLPLITHLLALPDQGLPNTPSEPGLAGLGEADH